MKKNLILILFTLLIIGAKASEYRTLQYRHLEDSLCKGWHTCYNSSQTTFVHLPDGFSINVCLAMKEQGYFADEIFKSSHSLRSGEMVFPGLRSDDGSYTSLRFRYKGRELLIESAADGNAELILITPVQLSPDKTYKDNFIVLQPGFLYGNNGTISKDGSLIRAKSADYSYIVGATSKPISADYINSTSINLSLSLEDTLGIYVGEKRTLQEIKDKIHSSKERLENEHHRKYGDMTESFIPMQTILAWNTIYDAKNKRMISPVTRCWNYSWGGYILFDWDTYFASYMFSLYNKGLAFSNAIAITKAITPDGFIPNFESSGLNESSWDRSQPPVGSEIILRIYKHYPEKWFLEEVYDELLTWNRWWISNRMINGYLAWGSYGKNNGKEYSAGLQGAKFESGLDNSPMYDSIPMNKDTHTMELADVGLNSMYVMDCNALAEIATILGKKQDVRELKERAKEFSKKVQELWDEKSGMFLNRRTDNGSFSHRISPTNFYPMLAGICSQKQAERMIKDYYFNPEYFHGEYVMPSISRNDPGFGDNNYWRGRIWAPMNFLVYLGMQKYDVKDAREDLIARSKALLMKSWKENGGIFENYNSQTGVGNDVYNADNFYHWGALLTFIEFMEKGYIK